MKQWVTVIIIKYIFYIKVISENNNKKRTGGNSTEETIKKRKYLEKVAWNNIQRNKTAIEFWNILKHELESFIDQIVPLKKQGKRSRKKHLSKDYYY